MSCSRSMFQSNFYNIPDDWKVLNLEDICLKEKGSIISGPFGSNISSKFFVEDGVPVIRGNNLSETMDKFYDDGFVYITNEKADSLNTYAIKDDLIFTAAGTIGQVGIINDKCKYEKYIISNKQLRARVDSNIVNPLYAYYWYSTPKMNTYIKMLNTGSTIPLINLSILKSLPIPVPNKETQDKIVDILSSLDDKIELNNEINKTLEEMAQSIFKRWFVDFEFPNEDGQPYKSSGGEMVESEFGMIPKGWEVKELGELSLLKYGKMPKKEDIVDCGNPIFSGYKITGYHREYMFKEPQLIVVARGVGGTGDVKFTPRNCFLTNLSIAVILDNKNIEEYLYYYLKNANLRNLDTGSAQSQITITDLSKLKIILPTESILNRYHELTKTLLFNKESNQNENQCLIDLKELLLPKLMSGDIIFKNS